MDFGAIPPEINSARMYSGQGSGSLMAAASAWNALAAELNSTALGYDSVLTGLTGDEWLGPAAAVMADAAAPYVAWLTVTAAQAEHAATQARAAAAAYEAAFAAMVPPPVIAANRAEIQSLLQTNVLGLNSPKIAALEAQYGEMWAQDASAMYGYAGSSAAAVKVTPFSAPAQIANPAGQTMQSAAVVHAVGASAGASTQTTLSRAISAVPSTLQSLASPVGAATSSAGAAGTTAGPLSGLWEILFGTPTFPTSLNAILTAYGPYASLFYNTEGLPYFSIGMGNNFVQSAKTLGLLGGAAPPAAAIGGGAANALPALGGGLLGGGGVAAGLGQAGSVGGLSVPSTWTGAPSSLAPSAGPLPISSISAAPEAGAGNLLGGMPLAGAAAGASGSGPKYGFRPTVMARPPFAG